MIFTLQAISTFKGLPPNSVGGEPGPGDLRAAACGDLAVAAAASQRWRKRVTSSWSSIVLMCLMGEERLASSRGAAMRVWMYGCKQRAKDNEGRLPSV